MGIAKCEKCGKVWKNIHSFYDIPNGEWSVVPGEPTEKAKELGIDGFYKSLQMIHKKDNGRILFKGKINFFIES